MSDELSETIYRLAATGVEWRVVQDEVLAVDLEGSEYLGVNRAGTVLWTALAQGARREALVERLMDAEGVDAARAEHDVEQFLRELRERGLLTEQSVDEA
jgi:hypothetical protein